MEQAQASGLGLLAEFMLRPGDDPFVLPYPCLREGRHRMIAAWGAALPIKLTVRAVTPGPITASGNPASAAFMGEPTGRFEVIVEPDGELAMPAVVQLYGGPEGGDAPPGGGRSWIGLDSYSGLPLLVDFVLYPGSRPFTLPYPAMYDGPHQLTAAWGAVVNIALGVQGEDAAPTVNQGNPVTVRFMAEKGKCYMITVGPVNELPIPVVAQLFGGPLEPPPPQP